jgi:hypothetical protein
MSKWFSNGDMDAGAYDPTSNAETAQAAAIAPNRHFINGTINGLAATKGYSVLRRAYIGTGGAGNYGGAPAPLVPPIE